MRHRFTVAERSGTAEVPRGIFVHNIVGGAADASQCDDGDSHAVARSTVRGLFSRRIEHRVRREDVDTTASEIISNSRRWYLIVLGGLVSVFLSRWFAIDGRDSASALLLVIGLFFLLLGTSTATPTGALPRQQMTLETLLYPQLGPLSLVCAGLAIGIPSGDRISLAVSGMLLGGWIVHGLTTRIEDSLSRLSNRLSTWFRSLPPIPSRYIFVTAVATSALIAFVLVHTTIAVRRPVVALLTVVLPLGVVMWLLFSIPSRKAARIRVGIAAVISGLSVAVLPFQATIEIQPLALQSLTGTIAVLGSAVILAISWGVLWYGLFASQNLARARFLQTGREITTEQAAVAAYLMIATAGALLVSGIAVFVLLWYLSESGISMETWCLLVALGMPAGYLVAGSMYQLTQLASNVWYIRSHSDRSPDLSNLELPFEPAYPVWVVPTDDFYAGAYWDPLDRAIVLSQGAIEDLEAVELAAIITHEESHFEHRGALLQFIFALLPAFALMGKNVVYSIYDFYERELTADERAVDRLDDAGISADGADVMADILGRFLQEDISTMDGSSPTFLPTLQTVARENGPDRRIDRLFEFFYGYFAGSVHPSQEVRIRALKRDDPEEPGG